MSFEIWLLYASTVFLFMVTPGPSHLLMISNAMAHGFRPALATAAGDLSANTLQMLAASLGLAALIVTAQSALTLIKWAGVAYLLFMAWRLWNRSAAHQTAAAARSPRSSTLWLQGFLTSAVNPKAVVFFAALFPQFLDADQPLAPQLLALGLTYLAIDGAFLVSYGAGAGWLARKLTRTMRGRLDRLGAVFLVVAAIALSLRSAVVAR